jgi:glycogen synthase kinase 3 beta
MEDNNDTPIKLTDLEFPKNNVLGQGAFGKVRLAIVKKTGEKVAIKKVFQDKRYKNRELPIMQELHHPNIVELKSYYCTKAENSKDNSEFYLNCIMEYMPLTLSDLIIKNRKHHEKFDSKTLKIFSYQMLKCIGYLHSLGIAHRDIKPQNILIDPSDNSLKLCDFGCAKHLNKNEKNISYICSRYYRPPELVLGATIYTPQLDVWSMGCVIAELVLYRPIFAGRSASDQMTEIMKILGTPKIEEIKAMNDEFSDVNKLKNINKRPWKEVFKGKTNDELYIDLVSKLLVYEPEKRYSPYQAMCHPFFDEIKKPGIKVPKHMFVFKKCEELFDKDSINTIISQVGK